MMDVGRNINMVKALDGDNAKKVQYVLASGMNSSALEHSVPEQMFSTPDNPAEGVSAVKALKLANDQGIPIYTINQNNIDTILPQLQIDTDAKTDIRNAVNAGKEVTVSKTNITYNGWTGCGYIIIDPDTGAGAYMISGGMSGAHLIVGTLILLLAGFFLSLSILLLSATAPVFFIAFTTLIAIFLATATLSIVFLYGFEKGKEFVNCFYGGGIVLNATKLITRFLQDIGTILETLLTYYNVYEFGKCLRRIIEQ
jgi:hypothetical protein